MTRSAFHAQRLAYCLPWTLYSLVVHTCKLKGPKRSLMAARTPWHHARSMVSRLLLESHLKVSSVSLIVVQCLIYWFLCGHFWNLGRGNKAESILKVRWLRSSMLDHSCWLYLWFTGSASSRWLNCWAAPKELFWALRWEFGSMNPISGLKIFSVALLCSQAVGGQPTLHRYGAAFLVCGSAMLWGTPLFHCVFWVLAPHSASILPPKCKLGSWEKVLEWSTRVVIHSFIHSSTKYVFEHQGCREHYMDPIFEGLRSLVGRPHGTSDTCKTS